MDLKTLLAANKSKVGRTTTIRKPVAIADQDRPYSIRDVELTSKPHNVSVIQKKEPEQSISHPFVEDANKPDTNLTQSIHKPNTNLTQEVNTNSTQTAHTKIANNAYQTQTQHKPNTQPNTQKTQSRHKVDTNLTQTTHISALIGVQRMILLFIFEECKKARSQITEPLALVHIASGLEIKPGSIKTSIARLCEKAFIKINSFKNGRGGWSVYEIPDNVYKELLQMETQHKLHTKQTQTTHKVDTQPNTQPNTSFPSSSSLSIKETTTTSELPEEWNFDISSFGVFGFGKSQIRQLVGDGKLTATQIEESLAHFCYDHENDFLKKEIRSKINYLMKILRNGEEYVSSAYNDLLEAERRTNVERALKRKNERLEGEFILWEESLLDEQRKSLVEKLPVHLLSAYNAHGITHAEVRKWMFDYYTRNVK